MLRIKRLILACFICWQCCLLSGQHTILNKSYSVQFNTGELTEALQLITNNTGVQFGYRQKTIEGKQVEACTYNTKLSEILDKILGNNKLCYTLQGNQIIIHTACLPKYYTVSGLIIEDSTYKPLPYISVSVLNKPIGVIADASGFFEMNLPYNQKTTDTLVFSSLGYVKDTIIVNSLKTDLYSVILKPKTYKVPEIVVRPIEYVYEKWGNLKERSSGSLYLDTHGQQTALYIENKERSAGTIQSVAYFLSKKGNTESPFRVRIYDCDTAGKPGVDLIEDAIVVKPENVSGWYNVDISMLSIDLPKSGLFVSIEGVFPDEYEDYHGSSDFIDLANSDNAKTRESLTYGQRIGYNKKGRNDTWHYSMSKIWFQLDKQAFGIMIAMEVKYEKISKKEKTER